MGVDLTSIYFTDVYLLGIDFLGVHLMGVHGYECTRSGVEFDLLQFGVWRFVSCVHNVCGRTVNMLQLSNIEDHDKERFSSFNGSHSGSIC